MSSEKSQEEQRDRDEMHGVSESESIQSHKNLYHANRITNKCYDN